MDFPRGTDAALAVQRSMNVVTRERILSKFRGTNLNGAEVADILDILDNGDALLQLREPFYESGAANEVFGRLGWDESNDDQLRAMRHKLVGYSALAVALLTDAVPTAGAVERMTRSAAIWARVDTWRDRDNN